MFYVYLYTAYKLVMFANVHFFVGFLDGTYLFFVLLIGTANFV